MTKNSHPKGSHPPGGYYWGPDWPGGTPNKYEPPSNKNRQVLTAGNYTGSYSNKLNPDLQPDAHRPGYKWDSHMQIWYKPLA